MPAAVDELLAFAQRLLSEGKVDDAVVRLESGMQRMSTSPRVLARLWRGLAAGWQLPGCTDGVLTRSAMDGAARMVGRGKRDAIEGLAEVNVRLKRYEQAVAHFERLAKTWPEQRWFRYRYGVALGLEGSDAKLRKSIEVLQALFEEQSSALIAAKIGQAYEELGQTNRRANITMKPSCSTSTSRRRCSSLGGYAGDSGTNGQGK